jgi:hypothetical protein
MSPRKWLPVILNGVPEAIKVKHLIKALQECDPEADVGAAQEPIKNDADLQSLVITEVLLGEDGPILVVDRRS